MGSLRLELRLLLRRVSLEGHDYSGLIEFHIVNWGNQDSWRASIDGYTEYVSVQNQFITLEISELRERDEFIRQATRFLAHTVRQLLRSRWSRYVVVEPR